MQFSFATGEAESGQERLACYALEEMAEFAIQIGRRKIKKCTRFDAQATSLSTMTVVSSTIPTRYGAELSWVLPEGERARVATNYDRATLLAGIPAWSTSSCELCLLPRCYHSHLIAIGSSCLLLSSEHKKRVSG